MKTFAVFVLGAIAGAFGATLLEIREEDRTNVTKK